MPIFTGTAGDESIVGSTSADTIDGGGGNDTLAGGVGADSIQGGLGDDLITWRGDLLNNDGADIIDGGAGSDTLAYTSTGGLSSAPNRIAALTNGHVVISGFSFGTVNATGVETLNIRATVNGAFTQVTTLSGTDVRTINFDFTTSTGAVDSLGETVSLVGAAAADQVTATVSTDGSHVQIVGLDGVTANIVVGANDTIILNGGNGDDALSVIGPAAAGRLSLLGGAGNDTVTGSVGNDTLDGGAGANLLSGGDGSDVLTGGGAGSSTVFAFTAGQTGQDVITNFLSHSAGGGDIVKLSGFTDQSYSDLINNGHLVQSGSDVLVTDGTQTIVTLKNQTLAALSAADFGFPANIFIGGSGADTITPGFVSAGVFAGGVATPGAGAETIDGGAGSDKLAGGGGNDSINGGADGDTIYWNVGDGSDTVDGGAGFDIEAIASQGALGSITLAASGAHVQASVAGVLAADVVGVEQITLVGDSTAGHVFQVGDLSGTGVSQVLINPDHLLNRQTDFVIVDGTAGGDQIQVVDSSDIVQIFAPTNVTQAFGLEALDFVDFELGAGNDTLTVSSGSTAAGSLIIDGGAGADSISGSAFADDFIGGAGDDTLAGGAGADQFQWSVADGHDVVDGGDGFDVQFVQGDGGAETFVVAASGGQATVAEVFMSLNLSHVEELDINPLGGGDGVLVQLGDLASTDLRAVNIDLGSSRGQADSVFLHGGGGDDLVSGSLLSNGRFAILDNVSVGGVTEQANISALDSQDVVIFDLGDGDDDFVLTGAAPARIEVRGGNGSDLLTSNGAVQFDFAAGQTGSDVISNFHFHDGAPNGDVIELLNFADKSFDDLIAHHHLLTVITPTETDLIVTDGTQVIVTLQNVDPSRVSAADFLFG